MADSITERPPARADTGLHEAQSATGKTQMQDAVQRSNRRRKERPVSIANN